jgi:hypothetical protein
MPDMRVLIAARRQRRYAHTRPWGKLNAFLTYVFDAADLLIAVAGVPFVRPRLDKKSRRLALNLFKRVVRRHLADLEVRDRLALSDNFKETLLRFASVRALKKLYPLAENIYGLRYLDFLYYQIAKCRQEMFGDRPIVEVVWNEPKLFEDVCCLPNSCIILILHNGFVHGTRALSYSRKSLAAVTGFPDKIGRFYRMNKVKHPEDIEIISVNHDTLLTLTKVAKNNKAIICAPDVPNPKTGRLDFLSVGMFQLARYADVPLYFFDFRMDDDCTLRGFIKGPVDCSAGPSKTAEDFIGFCQSVSGRTFTIIDKSFGRASA